MSIAPNAFDSPEKPPAPAAPNPYRGSRRWLVGAVVVLVLAVVLKLGLLAYAMYVLVAMLLLSRWIARTWAENLHATRECNRLEAEVGDKVAVNVTIENRGPLPVAWVLWEELLPARATFFEPPALGVDGERMQLAMLPRKARRSLNYKLACNRRGYYQLGPLVVETGDLLGLHRRYRVLSRPMFLTVYPKVLALSGMQVASKRPIGEVLITHRLYEDPTRIAGVRRYEPGDPLNRVHWRATARTGELHSKIYQPSTVAGMTLVVDFFKSAYPTNQEPARSELVVTAAASVASAIFHLGQQVGLVTSGRDAADRAARAGLAGEASTRHEARRLAAMREEDDRRRPQVIPTRRGAEQLRRIMTTLARLELSDGLSFVELLGETESRLPRDATVVAFLSEVTPEIAMTLGALKRRGFAVTAIVAEYEDFQFDRRTTPLWAEGLIVRQLKDEASVASLCEDLILNKATAPEIL
jgi:uncharacterized protein (DUF58 family)